MSFIDTQYLLRDILQFDATLTDSMSRITNAHRTCDLILGVGDGKVGIPLSASHTHAYVCRSTAFVVLSIQSQSQISSRQRI